MKKSIKMFLTVCAFAFTVLLVSGTQSKAAVNLGLRQTEISETSIVLQWNDYVSAGATAKSYCVELSKTSATEGFYVRSEANDETSSTSITMHDFSKGQTLWARLKVLTADDTYDYSEAIIVTTLPEVGAVQNLVQSAATNKSFTIKWSPVAGAASYDVYRANALWNYTKVGTTQATSFTVSGLQPCYKGKYFVMANVKTANGFVVNADMEYAGYFKKIDCKTLPTKVFAVALNGYWEYSKSADFLWAAVTNADGYQIETRNVKNKVTSKTMTTGTSGSVSPFKKGQVYKTRVRAYVKVGTTYAYGPWSGYSYNATSSKVQWTRTANKSKIKVKWNRISGIENYKVSISTNRESGYKTVKTYGKNSKGCTITKCGKKKLAKNKTYYVKVEYYKKVGKKKVKSGIVSLGTCY